MYILAFNSCQPHTFIVHFIPEEGAAIDAVLIVSCLQNTPYRLHKYIFGRGEASKTASQLKISFVILFMYGMAGLSLLAGAHGSRHISFWEVICFISYSSSMYPGGAKSMGWGRSTGARWNSISGKIVTGLIFMDPIDAIDVSR